MSNSTGNVKLGLKDPNSKKEKDNNNNNIIIIIRLAEVSYVNMNP